MSPLETGVCTWSLQAPDIATALSTIKNELEINVAQLGFFDESVLDEAGDDKILATVEASGVELSGTCAGFIGEDYSTIQAIAKTGGYVPDDTFDRRFEVTARIAEITRKLGVKLFTVHVGFVPEEKGAAYDKVVDRLKRIANLLGEKGLTLTMESGQEEPEALVEFMAAVGAPNVKANFDPANLILYGVAKPLEAVGVLLEHIAHVHMKDATWSKTPRDSWGEEVVLGTGETNIPLIVSKLQAGGYTGPLVIEREAGDTRVDDIREGANLLAALVS